MKRQQIITEVQDLLQKIEQKKKELKELVKKEEPSSEYLYGADVKLKLKISESTLRRMRKRNEIPHSKIGRTYYYPASFFTKIIKNRFKNSYSHLDSDEENK